VTVVRKIFIVFFIVLALAGSVFAVWGSFPLRPLPNALAALSSNKEVTVNQESKWISFQPTRQKSTTGLVFYPGGHVDYRSYAPALNAVAARGYLVVLVRMPLSLAVFAPSRANEVIAAFPGIKNWAVGGHSLGGAMAANYIFSANNPARGLVFWAAYPASNNSIADRTLAVVSISGSQDGLATPEKISQSRVLLPQDTQWVEIRGGNHAGFGSYGPQPGDKPADISPQVQQEQIVEATVSLLKRLEN
jgi:hypothetical protein